LAGRSDYAEDHEPWALALGVVHFLVRALEDSGEYNRFPELLGRWQEMVDGGFSTWAEDITYWRSLCHAWSAFPLIEFLRGVLGVKPDAPGFARILIQPNTAGRFAARGFVPTPHGPVHVSWTAGADGFRLSVQTPVEIPVRIILPDGTEHSPENRNAELSCEL